MTISFSRSQSRLPYMRCGSARSRSLAEGSEILRRRRVARAPAHERSFQIAPMRLIQCFEVGFFHESRTQRQWIVPSHALAAGRPSGSAIEAIISSLRGRTTGGTLQKLHKRLLLSRVSDTGAAPGDRISQPAGSSTVLSCS